MDVCRLENTYAAVEGREALLTVQVPELCRRAGAGSNGGGGRNPGSRNEVSSEGGDAEACPVGLAKAQDGRACRTSS